MTLAPLLTLRSRRDRRLGEIVDDALADLASGEKGKAWEAVLAAIEVAYGPDIPAELWRKLDQLGACKGYFAA